MAFDHNSNQHYYHTTLNNIEQDVEPATNYNIQASIILLYIHTYHFIPNYTHNTQNHTYNNHTSITFIIHIIIIHTHLYITLYHIIHTIHKIIITQILLNNIRQTPYHTIQLSVNPYTFPL